MPEDSTNTSFRDEYKGAMASAMTTDVDRIRSAIDSDNHDTALLLSTVHAESILTYELQNYFEIHPAAWEELLGNKTFGWVLGKSNEKDLVPKDYRQYLEGLKNKRNNLAHDLGYYNTLDNDDQEVEELEIILEKCCDWLDSYDGGIGSPSS